MIIYILVALSISVTAFINLSPQFGSNPTAAQKRLYANYSNYENGEFQNIILKQNLPLSITELISLIYNSSYVISNDTGPAHMAAHLNSKGLTLFGSHTTAYKVSIERENFKAIQVNDLAKLSTDKVLEKINLN